MKWKNQVYDGKIEISWKKYFILQFESLKKSFVLDLEFKICNFPISNIKKSSFLFFIKIKIWKLICDMKVGIQILQIIK